MTSAKPIIAVTQRVDYLETRKETRDSLDQNLVRFLLHLGAWPLIIPNSLPLNELRHYLSHFEIDGVLLSGGNNIGEKLDRDETEHALLSYAQERKLPVLGICRGMQMLAFFSGTSLKKVSNHAKTFHQLQPKLDNDQFFPKKVNSYHDFSLSKCPDGYHVTTSSQDNEIESIKHKSLNWEGWMWHPERNDNFDEIDIARGKKIFSLQKKLKTKDTL